MNFNDMPQRIENGNFMIAIKMREYELDNITTKLSI